MFKSLHDFLQISATPADKVFKIKKFIKTCEMTLYSRILLLIIFFIPFSINAQNEEITTSTLLNKYNEKNPGISYAIIKDGKILKKTNLGLANIKKGIKARSNTNYRLASVTKQFTALSILMLIDAGKLTFASVLTDIFDDFPEYGKNITIQQLLSHTSGLLDYENLMKDNRMVPILDSEVLQLMKQQDSTKFIPGSQYDYSNSAYAVLAQIIEKESGKTYKKFIETEIFKPLKMKNSVVYTKDSNIKHRAYGYTIKNDSVFFNDQSITSSVQGDGGIYTSINDYFKWDQALQNNKLISSELKEKAYTIQSINPKSEWDYGYGWRIKSDGVTKIVSHSGHTSGFTNYVIKIPEEKLTIVILTNRYGDDTAIEIGDSLLEKYKNN